MASWSPQPTTAGLQQPGPAGYAVPVVPASFVAPNTDSLLSRFNLRSGDEVLGRFLVGDGNDAMWFKGVLSYNTIPDPRFEHCVYKILFEDGETLFYTVDYMKEQLEKGSIKRNNKQ